MAGVSSFGCGVGRSGGKRVRVRDPYPYQTRPCHVTFEQCQVTTRAPEK